jgi:transposase InsO family protein
MKNPSRTDREHARAGPHRPAPARPGRDAQRRPRQGTQLVWLAFGQKARDAGIAVSMGSKGDCYDNAVAESFFATIKKELVHRRTWPTRRAASPPGYASSDQYVMVASHGPAYGRRTVPDEEAR